MTEGGSICPNCWVGPVLQRNWRGFLTDQTKQAGGPLVWRSAISDPRHDTSVRRLAYSNGCVVRNDRRASVGRYQRCATLVYD